MSSSTLYSPALLAHARSTQHAGALEPPARHVRHHNPLCGDRIDLWLDDSDATQLRLGHTTRGCAVCVASAAALCAELQLQPRSLALTMAERGKQVVEPHGPEVVGEAWAPFLAVRAVPMRADCVLLPFKALAELLRD